MFGLHFCTVLAFYFHISTNPVSVTRPYSMITPRSISAQNCREYGSFVFETEDSPLLIFGDDEKINVSTCATEAEALIVNGEKARTREFPHMARIGYIDSARKKTVWACAGSLISENFILSAAHCANHDLFGAPFWAGLGGLYLQAFRDGEGSGRVDIRIKEAIVHPFFTRNLVYYDICLFRLAEPTQLSGSIRPICLPDGRSLPQSAVATGWGYTSYDPNRPSDSVQSPYLQKVELTMTSYEECSRHYANITLIPSGIDKDTQLCTFQEGKDTCMGDSGGPLQIPLEDPYCTYMLVGIISFGKGCTTRAPNVLTKVSFFMPWIESEVWSKPQGRLFEWP